MSFEIRKTSSSILTLLLFLLFGERASAQLYSVTDLGTLPGGTNSQAYAISNDGVVVGVSDAASDANYNGCGFSRASKPFIWTAASGMQVLGPSPVHDTLGFPPCGGGARGINDQRAVVGFLDYGSGGGFGLFRAFIWTAANGMLLIPSSIGGASDINNSGQVVGTSGASAFRWTATGGLESLGIAAQNSAANAINSTGQVAGSAGIEACNTGPVIWNAAGQPQSLSLDGLIATLPPYRFICSGRASGINDSGVAVGSVFFQFLSGDTGVFAFKRIGQNDLVQPLGELPRNGSPSTEAYGINNSEKAVGASNGRAFLWSPGVGIEDLNSLLDNSGIGWTLITAHAINEAGQIVGYGLHNGEPRAFLLAPAAQPLISSISPTSGPPGTIVTITGNRFGSVQGSSLVRLGSLSALVKSWSNTQIQAVVPFVASLNLSYEIAVSTPQGTSNGVAFLVTGSGGGGGVQPPGQTGVQPCPGRAGRRILLVQENTAASDKVVLLYANEVTICSTPDDITSDITLENNWKAWYFVTVLPTGGVGVNPPAPRDFLLGPRAKRTIRLTFKRGEQIAFFADASFRTPPLDRQDLYLFGTFGAEFLYRLFFGSPLPQGYLDWVLATTALFDPTDGFVGLGVAVLKGDVVGIVKAIERIRDNPFLSTELTAWGIPVVEKISIIKNAARLGRILELLVDEFIAARSRPNDTLTIRAQ